MKAFDMDELVFLWKEYGKAHDKDLTKDAQNLKKQIRKFVRSLPVFTEVTRSLQNNMVNLDNKEKRKR